MKVLRLGVREVINRWNSIRSAIVNCNIGVTEEELLAIQIKLTTESALVLVAIDDDEVEKAVRGEEVGVNGVLVGLRVGNPLGFGSSNSKTGLLVYAIQVYNSLDMSEWTKLWEMFLEGLRQAGCSYIEWYADNVSVGRLWLRILKKVDYSKLTVKMFCRIEL